MHRKTILVTGASRGIGRSIAVKFASEGYHVFLNCRTSVAELTAVKDYIENNYHTPCSIAAGDAGNAADVARMFADIHQTCGHLDVLVNNAGISYIGLLMDMSTEDWRQVIDTNLSSVFYTHLSTRASFCSIPTSIN